MDNTHYCEFCGVKFTRAFNLQRHVEAKHSGQPLFIKCQHCTEGFPNLRELNHHRLTHNNESNFEVAQSALSRTCEIYRKKYIENHVNMQSVLSSDTAEMKKVLIYESRKRFAFRGSIVVTVQFVRGLEMEEEPDVIEVPIRSFSRVFHQNDEYGRFITHAGREIQERIDDFQDRGSGWQVDRILFTDLEIGSCRSMTGGCGSIVSVCRKSDLKKVRFENEAEQSCFFESIACFFTKTKCKKKNKSFMKKHINMNIPTPVKVNDISFFEKENEHLQVKINVFHEEGDDFFPIYLSKTKLDGVTKCINLLLVHTKDDDMILHGHYLLIEKFETFTRKKYQKRGGKKCYSAKHFCFNCMNSFHRASSLQRHEKICSQNTPQHIATPTAGSTPIEFENHMGKFKAPVIGFYDFECVNVKPAEEDGEKTEKNQVAVAYSILFLSIENKIIHYHEYMGDDAASNFLDHLFSIEKKLFKYLFMNKEMIFEESDKKKFVEAQECHICEKKFYIEEGKRIDAVRDHCHYTGKFVGAAHGKF